MSEPTPVTPPAAPTPAPAAVIPPEVQAQLDNLKAQNAVLLQKEQARVEADFQAQLTKDFPAIKDLSVVAGATHEEKRKHAEKLNAMLKPAAAPAAGAAPVPTPPANPGDALTIPPMGAPGGEAGKAQAESQMKLELAQAQARGDVSTVYDKCVALQPEPYKRVVAGAR